MKFIPLQTRRAISVFFILQEQAAFFLQENTWLSISIGVWIE